MNFEFYRLRFHFEAQGIIRFPAVIPANILRGAFGSIFRRIACIPGCKDARTCPVRDTCAYARTFEPGGAAGAGPSGLSDWPRPFVFRAAHLDGRTVLPNEHFHFDVIVFQIQHPPLEHFQRAFAELASEGLGPGRGRASLERVEQIDQCGAAVRWTAGAATRPSSVRLDPDLRDIRRVTVQFVTPTELKFRDGIAAQPEFGGLLSRVRDRLSTLSALYGRGTLDMDFAGFGARAAAVCIEGCDLRQVRATRLSSRTGQRHPLGGFTGEVVYTGSLGEFVPFLEAAQFAGVGRQSSWGKGEIRVKLSPESPGGCTGISR